MNNYIKEGLRFFILLLVVSLCFCIYKYVGVNNVLSSSYDAYKVSYNREIEQLRNNINKSNLEELEKKFEELERQTKKEEKIDQYIKQYGAIAISTIDEIAIHYMRFKRIKMSPEECVQEAYLAYKKVLTKEYSSANLLTKYESLRIKNIEVLPTKNIVDRIKVYDYAIKYINLLKQEMASGDFEYFSDLNLLKKYCIFRIKKMIKNSGFNNKKTQLSKLKDEISKVYSLKEKENKLAKSSLNEYINSHFPGASSFIQQLEHKKFILKIVLIVNIFLLLVLISLLLVSIKKDLLKKQK